MTKDEARSKFLKMVARLVIDATSLNIEFIVTDFDRTAEEQAEKYAIGRTRPGKKNTNCDGYKKKSFHQDFCAIDIAIMKNEKIMWDDPGYEILGRRWEMDGGTWGGTWDDGGHFELRWRLP
jgi:hypothetical protein